MRSAKVLLTAALLITAGSYACHSQNASFFNVGMKIGHVFGSRGGFIYGIEVSYTQLYEVSWAHNIVGVVCGVDFFRSRTKLHASVEYTSPIFSLGVSIGPSFLIEEGQPAHKTGFTLTTYIGYFVYPYFSLTTFPEYEYYDEFGLLIKGTYQFYGPYYDSLIYRNGKFGR